jgi:hypothetical protein
MTCACRKLNPAILVMQSAQGWATKNVPGVIDGVRNRRIFLQGEMRAGPLVIFHVTEQQVTEVALAEYNNAVKAFPSIEPISLSAYPFCQGSAATWGDRGYLSIGVCG